MRAKEYLRQAYRLEQRINSDIREVGHLRQMADSISSPQLSADKVQTSPSGDAPFVNALTRIWEMESKIDEEIDRLIDMKGEIRSIIDTVPNDDQQMLLRFRYIHFENWDEIADEMNYSLRWVHIMHGKALAAVDEILASRGLS